MSSSPLLRLFGAAALFALPCVIKAQPAGASLIVVSGSGLLVATTFTTPDPTIENNDAIRVLLRNSAGKPIANETVTWTTSSPTVGALVRTTTQTDANGIAGTQFTGAIQIAGNYQQVQITAAAQGAAVSIPVTVFAILSNGSALISNPQVQHPTIEESPLKGTAGAQSTVPVQFRFADQFGQPVPNVGLRLVTDDPGKGPTIACAETLVLSDAKGVATCTPVFGGKPGQGSFTVHAGGDFFLLRSQPFEVTLGAPSLLKLISGNNQAGPVGVVLPAPLTLQVTDAAGNPIPGTKVDFAPVIADAATFRDVVDTADANGEVSARIIPGIAGPIQVRASIQGATVSATYTATGVVTVTGLSIVSGNNQTASPGAPFPQPLVVQVSDGSKGVQGVPVQFAISGGATLSAPSATTNAEGTASVTATAGNSVGPVVVTASTGDFSQSFQLTVIPPGPQCTPESFYNTAYFSAGSHAGGLHNIAPGSIATIACPGLAPGIQGVTTAGLFSPVMMQLAGLTVKFGSSFAPILAISNINDQETAVVQVPVDVAPGATDVTLTLNGTPATIQGVPIATVAPGLFAYAMSDNVQRAFLTHADGSAVSLENPARRGETLTAWTTGLNIANAGIRTGTFGTGTVLNAPNIVVGLNNQGVTPTSVTYASNLLGIYQVSFAVPDASPSGTDIAFIVAVFDANGNLIFSNPSTIPVQ
jgi:uncharacterized protein (TIGR03437 family)